MDKRTQAETEGVTYVQRAFKLNTKSTAAALALTSVAALGGNLPLASKLAERAVQYADNKRHSVLANSERGRLGFIAGDVADASPYFTSAKNEDPNTVNMITELTLAQIAIKNGNLRDALNFVEQTAKRLGGKGPLEFTVLQASLLAYPHPGMPAEEMAKNLQTARALLTDVQKEYAAAKTDADRVKLRGVVYDSDAFIELAKLWQDESLDKAITAYQTAITIKTEVAANDKEEGVEKPVDYAAVRLSTNLASLYAVQGNLELAERMFQEAIQAMGPENGKAADMLKTVIAYDLGRANEKSGDSIKAAQWYRDVLRQHPEHLESKVRLAHIAGAAGRNSEAHNYLKECLHADENNLTLRSAYTNFLIAIGSYREALAFTTQTLKYDHKDSFTFTALGWLHFTLGREAKSAAELAERSKQYLRSAEAYQRALSIDPTNAVAAQGLAIALVEDTLTPKALQLQPGSSEDLKARTRLAGQALTVLGRIKDSLPEAPVNINIGHCYFLRGEDERAIEAVS
jgi:RNA polymerase-associated protein CTR9